MRRIAVIVILLVVFSGLQTASSQTAQEDDWTFIFYMGGDGEPCNISDQVDMDIEELSSVPLRDEINLIILSDEKDDGNTRLTEIKDGKVNEMSLKSIEPSWERELDLSHRSTLRSYVEWAVEQYPAEHYMLNLWGHGKSWKGMPLEDHELLTLDEMDHALSGQTFDIIGFDACTMGCFETYYQLKEHAEIIIASEMEETIEGWPYDLILKRIVEEDELVPEELSKLIIEEYVDWSERYSGVPSGLTAVRTDELPVEELDDFSEQLTLSLPYYFDEVEDARLHATSYLPYPFPKDLYHFSELVDSNIKYSYLDQACVRLQDGIENSIISHQLIPVEGGRNISNSHGYGISIPRAGPISSYDSLDIMLTGWDDWLDFYSTQTSLRDPPKLQMTVTQTGETAKISITHDSDEFKLEVLEDGQPIYSETFTEKQKTINIDVGLGEYIVESYIYGEDGLYNHKYTSFNLSSTFTIQGRLRAGKETTLKVFNTRTNRTRNFTIEPGDYQIGLGMPYFCEQGDELRLTYSTDGSKKEETVIVEGESFQQDIDIGYVISLGLWMMISQILLLGMLAVVYLKRKTQPRPWEG